MNIRRAAPFFDQGHQRYALLIHIGEKLETQHLKTHSAVAAKPRLPLILWEMLFEKSLEACLARISAKKYACRRKDDEGEHAESKALLRSKI